MSNSLFRTKTPAGYKRLFNVADLNRENRSHNEAVIRELCDSSYLGDRTSVCRILGRYKIYVETNDIGVAPHLMLDGYWEMWVTEVIASLVRPGMVVADAGANVGYFTLLMADLCGPTGKVFAFEPNPAVARLLTRSIALNGFWSWASVHGDPLADTNGAPVELIIPDGDPKNAHILAMHDGATAGGVPMATRRLDSDPAWATTELIKIDVEGAEELVWRGMDGLVQGTTLRTVILEFASSRYTDPRGFLAQLTARGFALSYIDFADGIVPCDVDRVMQHNPHQDIMLVLQR